MTLTRQAAKTLGAFYTPPDIAAFLVWWALRAADNRVLDPSFGGGVFLKAAAARLCSLGGKPQAQIFGVELDSAAHRQVGTALQLAPAQLICGDFLDIAPQALPRFDAVIGNPPYVRYQQLSAAVRDKAAQRARAQGVALSRRASLWAAFVVHSVAMLKPGGRLAMVLPAELLHAAYAEPLRNFLQRHFGRLKLLRLRQRLFPALDQEVVLLLAEGHGGSGALELLELDTLAALSSLYARDNYALAVPPATTADGRVLDAATALYQELAASGQAVRLSELAAVGIGYISGANRFFHLSPARAAQHGLPDEVLRPAVFRSAALAGVRLTWDDWHAASQRNAAGYLLCVPPRLAQAGSVQRYLAAGVAQGVAQGYKCRRRTPWYRIPGTTPPDALLTAMSAERPQLAANTMGALVPNTFHALRLYPHIPLSGTALAALWQSSLSSFSAELEGHALGGGLLKLEPAEARRLLVPYPQTGQALEGLALELDAALRRYGPKAARALADRALLEQLGLSRRDCALLAEAAAVLRTRRTQHRHRRAG